MASRNSRKIQLLEEELNKENFLKTDISLPRLKLSDLKNSKFSATAMEIFDELGGLEFQIPADLNYHLQYNGLLIQLDDELHFNRYRKISLQSDFYSDFKGFSVNTYRSHCRLYEKECIKSGLTKGIWENQESQKVFGPSEDPGDLSLDRKGSSGWKYRAWTDFLQDIAGEIYEFKVLRLSVYDKIMISGKVQTIGQLINSSNSKNYAYVAKSLVRRIINLKGS